MNKADLTEITTSKFYGNIFKEVCEKNRFLEKSVGSF